MKILNYDDVYEALRKALPDGRADTILKDIPIVDVDMDCISVERVVSCSGKVAIRKLYEVFE